MSNTPIPSIEAHFAELADPRVDRTKKHNFAILRRIALNLLKQENSVKLGIHNKRLNAAWDDGYLMKVLSTLFH